MSVILFRKDWRDRLGDKTPPSARIIEVINKNDPFRGPCRLLVEREEVHGEYSASIKLSYVSLGETFGGFNNHPFCGKWERFPDGQEKISITGGAVMLTGVPRGAHIGTYLFDEIVRWAKQWPKAQVRQISLSEVDADDVNRERRNSFYEQFGIVFDYSNGRCSGRSKPMSAQGLSPVAPTVWEQDITEWGVVDFLRNSVADIESKVMKVKQLQAAIGDFQKETEAAEKAPVLWALRMLVAKHQGACFVLFLVACIAVSVWRGP